MNYAEVKYNDIANGPGVRVSIFVTGCHFHCKGCFNSVTWDRNYGKVFDDSVLDAIIIKLSNPYITGLTILGGEPLEEYNLEGVNYLIDTVKSHFHSTKTIWLYSGYTYESMTPHQLSTVDKCDVLVDGQFVEELKDISLRFRGSRNQRILTREDRNQIKLNKVNPV